MATGEMYPYGPGNDPYGTREREVGLGEMFKVLWSPVDVMRRAAHNQQVLLGFATVALLAAVSLINSLLQVATGVTANQLNSPQFQDMPPEMREAIGTLSTVGSPIMSLISPFISWLLISGAVYLAARVLGGRGPFTAMLAVVGLAFLPSILSGLIGIPLGLITGSFSPGSAGGAGLVALFGVGVIGFLIGLAVFVWQIALIIIGTRFAQNLDSYGRSGGACALSCGGCLGILLLLIIGLAALAALLAGA